jgi:hypothetical protein
MNSLCLLEGVGSNCSLFVSNLYGFLRFDDTKPLVLEEDLKVVWAEFSTLS